MSEPYTAPDDVAATPLVAHSSAGRLAAELVYPRVGSPRGTLILCHGFPSGAPADPGDPGYAGLARDLVTDGFAAATFAFRGCYGSPGDFSLSGWVEDLSAVVDALCERGSEPLGIVGSSLGGSVALLVAADDPRVGLVATLAAPAELATLGGSESRQAFLARARDIGVVHDPRFPRDPDAWADEFLRFRPESAAARLGERPLLVLHGDADDVVPAEHAGRLAAQAPLATMSVLRGAGHRLRRDPVATGVLFTWLRTQMPAPRG